ncbi:hypothetical protein GCM10007923_64260 [Shinella yambaruensis]|uniref:Uncharacterized protein n=1 Tax=Shinella yambaruensis TaxID=415996 RepID=A0ABQ5ZTY1_9HYPH|nr:hypothetical protein GCM10007923_64260 [Shinella yambaruensis]
MTKQAKFERLSPDLSRARQVAAIRQSALEEIEAMTSFSLSAEEMREEIGVILSSCTRRVKEVRQDNNQSQAAG